MTVRTHIVPNNGNTIPGYTNQLGLPALRDGYAAMLCNYTGTAPTIDSVEFLMP